MVIGNDNIVVESFICSTLILRSGETCEYTIDG
jgi:hypothetical protein